MLGIVLARKLREGKTYEDFRAAWFPDTGYGTPARVLSGAGILDQREIVTVGFVDANAEDLVDLEDRLAAAEIDRHHRIAEVCESTEIRLIFEITDDDDFEADPSPTMPGIRGYPWLT
jgi:hypothetical protein